jgi:hypothetical protein
MRTRAKRKPIFPPQAMASAKAIVKQQFLTETVIALRVVEGWPRPHQGCLLILKRQKP